MDTNKLIKQACKRNKLTKTELSKRMKLNRSSIYSKNNNPQLKKLIDLSNSIECSILELIHDTEFIYNYNDGGKLVKIERKEKI